MSYTLDASGVMCWLDGEPGGSRVLGLIAAGEILPIHAVNLVEVQYLTRRHGEQALRNAMAQIRAAGIQVVRDMDDELLEIAVDLKANHAPIALGDVFAVALAVRRGATLLTTDRNELEKIARAGICQIEFLR